MPINTYNMTLSGVHIPCGFRYADTAGYFGRYITGPLDQDSYISLSQWSWDFWPQTGKPVDGFAEYSMFVSAVSSFLLPFGRCAIHSAAICFQDHAYLIAAESGVGKSTQVRTLQTLYPEEFSVICGDRPVLEAKDNGQVIVHPSPWNGKENWHGADAAPLGGLVLLRRGTENGINVCKPNDAAAQTYSALIHNGETVKEIQLAAQLADAVLKAAPVWFMTTSTVPESTQLLYDAVFRQGGNDEL